MKSSTDSAEAPRWRCRDKGSRTPEGLAEPLPPVSGDRGGVGSGDRCPLDPDGCVLAAPSHAALTHSTAAITVRISLTQGVVKPCLPAGDP